LRQAIRTLAKPGTSQPTAARAAHASGGGAGEPVRATVAQVEAAHEVMCQFYDGNPNAARRIADEVVAAGEDADEVASLRQRLSDMADEYGKAGESWDRTRERLEAEVERVKHFAERGVAAEAEAVRQVEAERDRLAETVARVEALADGINQPGAWVSPDDADGPDVWVTHVRAALDGYRINWSSARGGYVRNALPEPAPATPETPHAPAGDAGSVSGQSGTGEALGGAQGGEAHPCGHIERQRGCGGCDPGAVEFVKDDDGPWRRVGDGRADR
jgi:hypothetical protein